MRELDPRVICPFFDVFMPFLPESFRCKARCGVRHGDVSNGERERDRERI